MDLIAKFAVRIRAVQCSPAHKEEILKFFRTVGVVATESAPKNLPGSVNGGQTRIILNPDFEPWKLKPDELKKWEKLPVVIVEKY